MRKIGSYVLGGYCDSTISGKLNCVIVTITLSQINTVFYYFKIFCNVLDKII